MNTTIYVFSGTGTSLAAAQKIANELGETTLVSMANLLKKSSGREIIAESSRIGIIFPCYFGEMPPLVLEFVRKLNLDRVNYIFSVVTAGGNSGYSLRFLERELERKGKKLDYGKAVVVASNYIVAWYYHGMPSDGESRKKALQMLDDRTKEMAKDIASEKKAVDKSQYLFYKIPHILAPKAVVKDTRPWDREFSVNEQCNGCSTCSRVCPVQNIKMKNHQPEFQHNCQRCMACIQYCPNNAICFNGKPMDKPKYFHPEYPANEMIKFVEAF